MKSRKSTRIEALVLALACLVSILAAGSLPCAAEHRMAPTVQVRDSAGRRVLAMYPLGHAAYRVSASQSLDVHTDKDTSWAIDAQGRLRMGVRKNDEDATMRLMNGLGVTTLFLRPNGQKWRGEDQEGAVRWSLKGARGAWWMYDASGKLIGSARGGHNAVTIADAHGSVLYTMTRLEPLAGALWFLNRKNPYAAAALLGAFAAW